MGSALAALFATIQTLTHSCIDHLRTSIGSVGEIWTDTPTAVQTILVAGVGTIIGAWVSSRSQAKRRVLDEIRAIIAARALCFSVTNRVIGLKRQHIRPMAQRFFIATMHGSSEPFRSQPLAAFPDRKSAVDILQPRLGYEAPKEHGRYRPSDCSGYGPIRTPDRYSVLRAIFRLSSLQSHAVAA